jgi:serine/threonine protein kinase
MNPPLLIGCRLGKYEIRAEIGKGGMGTVYLGYDPQLDRQVAVKVLAPHLVWEQDFVERFVREARAAAHLQHSAIVTIHDVGQEGGRSRQMAENRLRSPRASRKTWPRDGFNR